MSRAVAYLQLPEEYCASLGHLRWATGGDAIEYPSGVTFAFNREVSTFLSGLAAGGDFVHFGFVLHLMHLIGCGWQPRNSS